MLWLAHMGVTLLLARTLRLSARWPVVLVAGILPDLIDKPLSLLVPWWSGRSFGHTPLLALTLLLAGLACRRPGPRGALVVLGFGSGLHILLDNVTTPAVLAWPLLGWHLPGHGASLDQYVGYLMVRSSWPAEVAGLVAMALVGLYATARRRHSGVAALPARAPHAPAPAAPRRPPRPTDRRSTSLARALRRDRHHASRWTSGATSTAVALGATSETTYRMPRASSHAASAPPVSR